MSTQKSKTLKFHVGCSPEKIATLPEANVKQDCTQQKSDMQTRHP